MHFLFRLFFLFIEPVSALAGFVAAASYPQLYLSMTHAGSAIAAVPVATEVILRQLANLYLYFALIEFFVLRSTASRRVWKTTLACMLLADIGHLWACAPLGSDYFWRVDTWDPMAMGNVPFVYVGASMRIAFLALA